MTAEAGKPPLRKPLMNLVGELGKRNQGLLGLWPELLNGHWTVGLFNAIGTIGLGIGLDNGWKSGAVF